MRNRRAIGLAGRCVVGLSICAAAVNAADWPSVRGDAQRTGWQPLERHLTAKTVKGVRLLWSRRVGEYVSAPILLGPIITHRGIKELALVQTAAGGVVALDADLGKIFWQRELPLREGGTCAGAVISPLAIPSLQVATLPPASVLASTTDDDDFSDGSRPLVAVSPEGRVHLLRASTGEDFAPTPIPDHGYAETATGFQADLILGWDVGRSPKPCRDAGRTRWERFKLPAGTTTTVEMGKASAVRQIAIGAKGVVYGLTLKDGQVEVIRENEAQSAVGPLRQRSRAKSPTNQAGALAANGEMAAADGSGLLVFPWQGEDVAAFAGKKGLQLWRPRSGEPDRFVDHNVRQSSGGKALSGLTTWMDSEGSRWIAALEQVSGGAHRVTAFRVVEQGQVLRLEPQWQSPAMQFQTDPIVAAGVVYLIVERQGKLLLSGLDAASGAPVLEGAEGIAAKAVVGGLAFANGHICLTGGDGVVYCFGLPIEI